MTALEFSLESAHFIRSNLENPIFRLQSPDRSFKGSGRFFRPQHDVPTFPLTHKHVRAIYSLIKSKFLSSNPGYNLVHELLVRMREQGMNVWGEIYPYAAGSTALNAVFLEPEVWVQALGNKYEDTLQDVATGEFYTQKSREEMLKKEPTRLVLVYKSPESAIVDWIKMPGVAIGSDGMPMIPDDNLTWDTPFEDLPNTHPRTSGSFATVLRVARENNIPLMQAVSMTSYNYAKPLGDMGLKAMQVRGRMQEGMVADITIFDPETVRDNSTYAKGTLPSTGILHVIVNGTIVMKDQKPLKGVNPGQPIRFESVKSNFEPLTIEGWHEHLLCLPDRFWRRRTWLAAE